MLFIPLTIILPCEYSIKVLSYRSELYEG